MVQKLALSAVSALLLTTMLPEKVEADIQAHYKYNFPTYYHSVLSVGRDGKMVEIEDDSSWQIDTNCEREVSTWYAGDPLVISPGNRHDTYYITNVARNVYVSASLVQGPKRKNPNTCQITHIDRYSGIIEVCTVGGQTMRWMTDPRDRFLLQRWAPGNTIILGANDSWYQRWFNEYNSILIGVENYPTYIRAKYY